MLDTATTGLGLMSQKAAVGLVDTTASFTAKYFFYLSRVNLINYVLFCGVYSRNFPVWKKKGGDGGGERDSAGGNNCNNEISDISINT